MEVSLRTSSDGYLGEVAFFPAVLLADFSTVDQLVLGLNLDTAMDFEAMIEALEGARDALLDILE